MDFKVHVFNNDHTLLDSHELMAACFKDESALSIDFLNWFYLENPTGQAIGAFAYDEDRAVSQACVIPQLMSFNGETHRVGLVANACTLPQYQRRGLLAENLRLIVEEAMRLDFSFLYAFPNPSSFGGFIKNRFSVPQEFRLEVAPVSYTGIIKEFRNKEKFETLASTIDLDVKLPEGRNFETVNAEEGSAEGREPVALTNTWHLPLTREQLSWRYLSHPTRKYHVLRHLPTKETVIVRFIKLYGMSSCIMMKTSCVDGRTFNHIMRDLKYACRGVVNFITMFHSSINSSFFSKLAHGRMIVPRFVSPRKFPMLFYPLNAELSNQSPQFELAIGDYDAI